MKTRRGGIKSSKRGSLRIIGFPRVDYRLPRLILSNEFTQFSIKASAGMIKEKSSFPYRASFSRVIISRVINLSDDPKRAWICRESPFLETHNGGLILIQFYIIASSAASSYRPDHYVSLSCDDAVRVRFRGE